MVAAFLNSFFLVFLKVHGGAVEVAQCFLGSNATAPTLVDKEKLVIYKQQLR